MPLIQKLVILLVMVFAVQAVSAQKSLRKAEAYSELNAHFLSIKYFQKHLKESTSDRQAMQKLAISYRKANMPFQSQKWFLKANDCKDLAAYFRKLAHAQSAAKTLYNVGGTALKAKVKDLYSSGDIQQLTQIKEADQLQFALVAASSVSKVL